MPKPRLSFVMEQFLLDILAGASPAGVVDLCLDHRLVADAQTGAPFAPWTSIGGLSDWLDLEVLSISGHPLEQVAGLPPLPHLRQLCLSLNALEDLQGFPELPALEALDLSHNLLTALDGLPALPRLHTLDLGHNHVRSTDWLAHYPSLRHLTLSGNRGIRSLDGIGGLQALESLFLRQCFVVDWAALRGLSHLSELAISPGSADGLAVLGSLPQLTTLHVQAKGLHGHLELPPLPHLRSLHIVGGTGLQAITGLTGAPGLTRLGLRGNGLTEVPDLKGLAELKFVDLSDNPLQNRAGLAGLGPDVELRLVNTGGRA